LGDFIVHYSLIIQIIHYKDLETYKYLKIILIRRFLYMNNIFE